jgi:protease-4
LKNLLRKIARSLGFCWRVVSFCRRAAVNLIFLLLVVLVVSAVVFRSGPKVPKGAALVLAPRGTIVEQESEIIFQSPFLGEAAREETVLADILMVIRHAKDDPRIKLLVLDFKDMGGAGISKLQEIGNALEQFKTSGKQIIAYADFLTQPQYYLAAHADTVYLHPFGGVFLQGYGLYRNYFKNALEKLRVQFHVFSVGKYKSALEPFFRNDMSPSAREANVAWLTAIWNAYTSDVAQQRGLQPRDIEDYVNGIAGHLASVGGDTAELALQYGLVDGLKTRDEVQDELMRLVGPGEDPTTFKQVSLEDYLAVVKPLERKTDPDKKKIAVIVAEGVILDGNQPTGKIGGDSMSDLIRQARNDENVKALVLRIDSPGGSAFASELIRRELELNRKAGKPVIVSMGSVAASGGYWVASAADEIWATPTTITGSIGIFGAFPTFEQTLQAIGIQSDGVGTTELADAFDVSRPLKPILSESIALIIENGYHRFLRRVSEGRNMSEADVEKAAEGRVWPAETALRLHLVDAIGNLQDAIGSAAEKAGLTEYDVIHVEKPLSPRERLIRELNKLTSGLISARRSGSVTDTLDLLLFHLKDLMQLNDPRGLYAYCLMCNAD